MNFLRGCVAMLLLVGLSGTASGAAPVAEVVATQVVAADSLRTHTFSLLARGQVTEAIDYWVLTTGKEAPAWLLAARASFDASKQVAGACQGVAQSLHTAFTQLGGKPEFVQLSTRSQKDFGYIMFKLVNGKDVNVSHTGYHVLVRMQGRAYDAYTGAAGMPWAEYMSRLGARTEITEKVVETVARVP
ncbi:hypothetical protein [Cystobacter ferrugineus]|uniref:Lipoprotein n=1 Tax=Cystobacter ferrugineus TaxID=83449 RepID=A0A1L9B314_9BACT|nr:hypothetical protein [Cystobacter ferrugineus]OJH36610.1 hypothetical protein BON30_33180 [Cystobacter ferrugineus]